MGLLKILGAKKRLIWESLRTRFEPQGRRINCEESPPSPNLKSEEKEVATDILLSAESFKSRRRRRSIGFILDFKEGSSGMPDIDCSSEEKEIVTADVGLVQSADYLQRSIESFLWWPRIRSIRPILDFKERSSLIPEDPDMDSEADDDGSVRSAKDPKTDEVIHETHVGSGMETLLKHLPSATSAGLLTASCLLLIPLVILRRSS